MTSKAKSLLEQLADHVAVDADTYDVDFIRTLPLVPHDATSNQGFIHAALIDPRNTALVEAVVAAMPGAEWEDVYAACAARLAANVLPVISGRVLVQVSTRDAYSGPCIIAAARRFASAYAAAGIPAHRFAVKIPLTSAGVAAAMALHEEGIATLGTALFSVPQAIGAAQARMSAVSMYLNEPRAHSVPGVWLDVADPATQAPMAARHVQIRAAYDAEKEKGRGVPEMKTASFCAPRDVLACAELGADHVTVGIPELTDLMEHSALLEHREGMWHVPMREQALDEGRGWQPWMPREVGDPAIQALAAADPLAPGVPAATFATDYTAEEVLDAANEGDAATRERLKFALDMFAQMEEQSRTFLEGLMAAAGGESARAAEAATAVTPAA